uniref:Rho guanine nucleotide exchange factor 15b n=1 Tax=Neolamprologus brichardi TaxID=32507 RepID=A0A3Q4M5S2_NEOBR
MSVQEPPTSTSPFKPEAKPRPEIPPKPQCSSPPLLERDSNVRRSGGKVKRIVNQFSKQESTERLEPATNGTEVEVELTGGGKVEAEHSHDTAVSPCCAPNCSCICHLQRPGMKLIWVPVNVEDVGEEGGEEDEEDWEDEEVERSDPGPHFILASLALTRSGSPPIPPKRMQSPQIQHGSAQNEEENIYEATLPLIYPTPKNNAVECKELDIPLIKVCKLGRRSKLTNSQSDPTSEFQKEGETIVTPDEVPPAIPPRIPLNQDRKCLTLFPVSEPLYQTYRASVITKEIRRQTVCRNISKTSADYAMDHLGPRGSPVPTPAQSTLWQELPNVRDSGVLENLSSDQCKYQESMFEVLTSEASYLRSLHVLTEHFMESRELEETMIIRDRKTLFSNILRIREVSERFLKDLEDRIFQDVVFSDICDIINYHAQHNFPAYIDYVRNQIYQEKMFTELMKSNLQFSAVISRLQESPQCQRLPFMSFLLLPFQRITRIKMLIESILKRTKEGTKEEQTASKALASVSKIIDVCNTEVGKMKQMEELIHISKTLEFDKLKAIPIISQTRYLEKRGELQEMSKGATLFNMRAKFTPVYFFLFNDLLVITAKKGTERFVVLDHAHRSLVQVQPIEESGTSGSPFEHCFNLTLLENHQGQTANISPFPCLSSPHSPPLPPLSFFSPSPRIGLYEGTRLSDGQKGWFPVANVIEITNEHVRRRNLRERYRVMQAATLVANSKTRTLQ